MKRIIAEGIVKDFRIGFEKKQSALARVISLLSGREPRRTIRALDGISFDVEEGEILGIIGKNGAGKSTLLKIIAGIYEKSGGRIIVNGNIISLINLDIGLKERLTMRDNIYLACSFFNLSKAQTKKELNSIVQFAELKDFINTKIYQFSKGMRQRLVFSIAIHCKPEILLLDEVFEVGDADFKKKSADKIKCLVDKGSSAIFVSHQLAMLEKYCNRIIWIDKGKIFKEGRPEDIVKEYDRSLV